MRETMARWIECVVRPVLERGGSLVVYGSPDGLRGQALIDAGFQIVVDPDFDDGGALYFEVRK